MRIRSVSAYGVFAAGLSALLLTTACAGPGYYGQAVSGHLQLMKQRQDIEQILASGNVDPELRHELELSVEIRRFAVSELDLPDNDSYTQFVRTGQDAVTWNVVAAPEFSLAPKQWCFLVSGCVPYRGYFDAGKAAAFADRLAGQGMDTVVSPAIAYSTLGWFDDPLLDTMFRYSDEQLAAFIFHELAHQKLYVKGDAAFNEAYARFVEEAGVALWQKKRTTESAHDSSLARGNGDGGPARVARLQAAKQFNALLQQSREKLDRLYVSDLPEAQMRYAKARIFDAMRADYRRMVDTQWGGADYYRSVLDGELNNASLALINVYEGGSCAFGELYRQADRRMAEFHRLAAAKARLSASARTAWLNQVCPVIASGNDL